MSLQDMLPEYSPHSVLWDELGSDSQEQLHSSKSFAHSVVSPTFSFQTEECKHMFLSGLLGYT